MAKLRTFQLRDGDHVAVDRALVRVDGKPQEIMLHGRETRLLWANLPIVDGALSYAPQAKRTSILASPGRVWHVIRRGKPQ